LACKNRGRTRVKSQPLRGSQLVENKLTPHSDRCRAQGSLRGRIARLRMGFVEKMPHWLPARCVQGPRRSLRGQSARRPGRDAFRSRGSLSWLIRLTPCRPSATRTRCRCATPIDRIASPIGVPCDTRTSTCRSFATIFSGLCLFLDIPVLLDGSPIPRVGPLQWGWITR